MGEADVNNKQELPGEGKTDGGGAEVWSPPGWYIITQANPEEHFASLTSPKSQNNLVMKVGPFEGN